jgi:hypothetical protein
MSFGGGYLPDRQPHVQDRLRCSLLILWTAYKDGKYIFPNDEVSHAFCLHKTGFTDKLLARSRSLGSPASRSVLDLQQQALLLAHRETQKCAGRWHWHWHLGY